MTLLCFFVLFVGFYNFNYYFLMFILKFVLLNLILHFYQINCGFVCFFLFLLLIDKIDTIENVHCFDFFQIHYMIVISANLANLRNSRIATLNAYDDEMANSKLVADTTM